MYNDDTPSHSMNLPCGLNHAGLGGLPWRTEALEEALLHLESWSGWFHRSNGREVVRTLIAEASPTELNHMVSFELHAHGLPCSICSQTLRQSSDSCSRTHQAQPHGELHAHWPPYSVCSPDTVFFALSCSRIHRAQPHGDWNVHGIPCYFGLLPRHSAHGCFVSPAAFIEFNHTVSA